MSVLEAIARISAERMLNCFAGGFAIALFTWALLRMLGRQNSGTRFAAWFSALIAIAALPLFGSSSANSVADSPQVTIPSFWALYFFISWAILALAGLARVAYGFWQVRRLRKNSTDLESADPRLTGLIDEICAGSAPQPGISVSDEVRVPVAIGFFRPMIVLPTWAVEELSPAELRAILLHEMAHLRRGDHWTNLAQKILGALFFFHPAVWWIEKQISLEREMACDDAVLAQVSSPRAYAECLVAVAEKSFLRRGLTLVQAAVSRARQTTLRIASILDARRPGATRVWKPTLLLVTGVCLACVTAVERAPRWIGFADSNAAAPPAVAADSSVDHLGLAGRAAVVPVAFRWNSNAALRGNSNAALPVKPPQKGSGHVRTSKPQLAPLMRTPLLRTKATVVKPRPPMLVLTSAPQAPPPQAVFVVMRSVQSDGTGSLVWSLTVWRVIITPEHKTQTGITPKAI